MTAQPKAGAQVDARARVGAQPVSNTTAKASVIVLHGSNDGKGIDKGINLPQLKRPPFSAYDSYKLLKRGNISLATGKLAGMQLPNNTRLGVTLLRKAGNRFVVKATAGKTKMTIKAKPGHINFLVQKYKNGILVVGLRVR